MGFWKWIVDTVAGPDSEQTSVRDTVPTRRPDDTQAADASAATGEKAESAWWHPEGETFTRIQPPQALDLSPEGRALENLLVSHFDGHDLTMPALPQVAERVIGRLGSRQCDFTEIADDVATDQVLAATVLRTVNSPYYRAYDQITSLNAAVTRLGAKALRTIMMQQALRAATFGKQSSDEFSDIIWLRSLASAEVMRGLANFTMVDPEEAFLIGLLHDIGNVIVLRLLFERGSYLRPGIDLETFEYLCYESHQEFGELVADAWKLPEGLKDLISNHHEIPRTDGLRRVERWMLQLTEMICSLQGFRSNVPYDLMTAEPVRELGLGGKQGFYRWLGELPEALDESVFA